LHNALLWIFLLDSLVDVSASHQKLDLSQDIHQQIAKLLDFFKQYRCLLVLDNETIWLTQMKIQKLTEWVIIDQGLSHMVNYSKGW